MFNLKNCGFKTFLELNLLPPFATLWVMKHGLKVPTECSASAAMMDQLSDGLIFWIFTSTWTRRKVKPQYSNHFIMMETSKQHSILGLVLKWKFKRQGVKMLLSHAGKNYPYLMIFIYWCSAGEKLLWRSFACLLAPLTCTSSPASLGMLASTMTSWDFRGNTRLISTLIQIQIWMWQPPIQDGSLMLSGWTTPSIWSILLLSGDLHWIWMQLKVRLYKGSFKYYFIHFRQFLTPNALCCAVIIFCFTPLHWTLSWASTFNFKL